MHNSLNNSAPHYNILSHGIRKSAMVKAPFQMPLSGCYCHSTGLTFFDESFPLLSFHIFSNFGHLIHRNLRLALLYTTITSITI